TVNGGQALEQISEHQPDVALLDIAMPDLGGIEAARHLHDVAPSTRLLLYTGNASAELAEQALGSGAQGVILKDAPLTELAHALEIVAGGGTYLDASLAQGVVHTAVRKQPALTARERAVLNLLAEGQTND